MTVRLSEDDRRTLARLAAVGGCSPSEALRRLLRGQSVFVSPERGQQPADAARFKSDALEHGAIMLAGMARKLDREHREQPDDDVVIRRIGLLRFAAEFLKIHADSTKAKLAKAKG